MTNEKKMPKENAMKSKQANWRLKGAWVIKGEQILSERERDMGHKKVKNVKP